MSRSFLSFTALASILFGAVGPVVAQNSKRLPQNATERGRAEEAASRSLRTLPIQAKGQPSRLPKKVTKFAKVEAFTEGKGAYIRWKMEAEYKNAGFRVYRTDKYGETPMSGFIPGSSFSFGDQILTDAEYHAYDPKGSQESAYYVEAVSDDGTSLKSGYLVPEYTDSIENIPGGAKIKEETFAEKAGDNRMSEELKVSSELQTEIQKGLLAPDPTKHREVISTPGAVRIASKADGLIRVTKAELQTGGFDVNSNSANWQIYMDGVELPMIIGANADYIEFLGKAIETLESDIRIYYLIPGTTAGRRIANRTARPPLSTLLSRKYDQTFVREDKKNFTSQILNGETENWFGDVVTPTAFDYKFSLSGVDRTEGTRKLTIAFQGFSITQHSVELTLNGLLLPTVTGSARFPFQRDIDVPVSALLDGENTLRIRTLASGDINLLKRLSIDFPRSYIAIENKLEFHTENYKNARVSGFSSPNIRVFDVTYEDSPRLLTNLQMAETNGTWGPVIPAGRSQVLYAVEANVYGTALSVTPIDPALLGEPSNTGTLILIAHPSLMAEANAWATYRSGQGIVTKVVDVNDIYDEFNYGVISSHAIEDFLLYAKNNWQTPPSYVLLFGDGHYDTKNYDAADPGYWNMVPARQVDTLYEQTGSDEALADFNDDGLADIPVGRIPARTGSVVTVALNKVTAWESAVTANSMNRGVLFAHDWPDGYDFKAMSDRVMSKLPASVPKLSISQTSATAQTDIINAVNDLDGGTAQAPGTNAGQYLLNYTGHGNVTSWRNTSFFSASQAPQLTNGAYPSLMISLTCLNGFFMTDFDGFAETMVKAPSGGAVAAWASTGKTTPDVQEIMAARFYLKLGEGNIPRLGDLINDAKAQVPAGADVRLSWALIGDPMLKVR
ncbi:MAG: C25 family cysteine peptidase [bacterium]|nr:C25 family cysteine peptidase [bacterium]